VFKMKAAQIFLSGNVQGVLFRAYAKVNAQKLGLRGYVRNLNDGRVEVWVEGGDDDKLFEMLRRLKRGPDGSKVTHTDITWHRPKRYSSFEIAR